MHLVGIKQIMSLLYLAVRLDLFSHRHSIWGLVPGVLQVGKILCVATQIPYTWLLSFLWGLWALSETDHCDGQCKHHTGVNWEKLTQNSNTAFPVAYKTTVFMRIVQIKPFGLPIISSQGVDALVPHALTGMSMWHGSSCSCVDGMLAPMSIGLF